MEFPILHDPGSIELLLSTVYKTDPPNFVDHDYLVSLGFKREVDEGLMKLLLFLGFIDENGKPAILWEKFRERGQSSRILQEALKTSYHILFDEFPNAYQEDGSTLMEFFRKETGTSDPNVAYMILTFKVLCDQAGLTETEPVGKQQEPVKKAEVKPKKPVRDKTMPVEAKPAVAVEPPVSIEPSLSVEPSGNPVIRIAINIDLDDKSDPELRDLAMKLLKKQLEL